MAVTSRLHAPRFSRTPHLVDLIAEAERLAAAVAACPEDARWDVPDLTAEAILASLALDGSPLGTAPDLGPANAVPPTTPAGPPQPDAGSAGAEGSWFEAMRTFDDLSDEHVQALEFAGVAAALASDDLAEELFTAPVTALTELHRRLVRGLVAPEHAGRLRTTEQAVHDASVGRIIHLTTPPERIAGELDLVAAWLGTTGAREHGLITSGVLHLELLRIHPFEAANGRLARAAARLVLRSRGLDPWGVAAPEPILAADPLGYHEEVASTLRRRDLSIWLERWGDAVTAGLRRAARRLGALDDEVPGRATAFVAAASDPGFTVTDYRAAVGVGTEASRHDLRALLDAGRIARVPGSRGLRFTIRGD